MYSQYKTTIFIKYVNDIKVVCKSPYHCICHFGIIKPEILEFYPLLNLSAT